MSTTIQSNTSTQVRNAKRKEGLDERGDPSRLLRYASEIPVVGGLATSVYGIEEIKHANTQNARVNGEIDAVRGVTGTVDGLASVPQGLSLVAKLPAGLLNVAVPLAAWAGAVTYLLDGARDIYNGIYTQDRSEKVIGLIKIGAAGISAAGACTLNPVLMIAGSVVYGGVAAYQNRKSIEAICHKVEQRVGKWIHHGNYTCSPHCTATT